MSQAVISSLGLAAGNLWTGSKTGTLKSDDLVRASAVMRVTTEHFEEIGVNAYVNTQLSQPPSGTVSPTVLHTVGEQFRSYGILLTDAEIQQTLFSPNPNTQQQSLLYITTLGANGFQNQLAGSIDLAAKKLRLLEIATACGALLDQLPSSQSSMRAMQTNDLSPQAGTQCYVNGILLNSSVVLTGVAAGLAGGPAGVIIVGGLGFLWVVAAAVNSLSC